MSFQIKDRPLKLVTYNPTAFTVPCIGHTFQGNFTAPCYDASILWRDYNDRSRGVRRVYGICMGRKKIYLWILYTSANSKDWNISGKGSCQVTQLQISLFSLTTNFNLLIKGRSSARPFLMAFIILYKHTVSIHPAWHHSKHTQLTRTAPRWSAEAILK